MQNFCEQFGPCSAIPPEWHWVNGYRNGATDDHSCGSSGRQYLAPRGPQPLVDHTGIHSVVKLDRPVGVCIQALAESRQLECPLWGPESVIRRCRPNVRFARKRAWLERRKRVLTQT